MFPSFSKPNGAYRRFPNFVDGSQLFAGKLRGSYGPNVTFSQFSSVDRLTLGVTVFGYGISDVIGDGTQCQVIRMDALPSITRVHDVKVAGRPVMNSVGQNMRPHFCAVKPDLSVAVTIQRTRPVPALFSGWVTRHEPLKCLSIRESERPDLLNRPAGVTVGFPPTVVGRTHQAGGCGFPAITNSTRRRSFPGHDLTIAQYPGLQPKRFMETAVTQAIKDSKADIRKSVMMILRGGR